MEPALEVDDLAKAFGGFRAVDGVSFAVPRGSIVALIGPNGAGKTTTFNLINGQLPLDRGRIRVAGRDVTGLKPRALWKLGVARTFQITATFASMTVRETVAVGLMAFEGDWLRTRLATLDAAATDQLIGDVGLTALAGRVCGTLAYGDLKRVELALALASQPSLLLMDEPTAGMAAAEREALMALAVDMARARGAAILFTEHDMGVVFRHAERVLVMSQGQLIADGTPAEVRESPVVREVYLGGAPTRGASAP